TQDTDSIFADPASFVDDRARSEAASLLANALGQPKDKLEKKLSGEKRFVWLARKVEAEVADKVRALNLDGVELVKEPKRYYPQRELAGHVLGFVGEDAGQEGLERELEQYLKGQVLSVPAVRDARGAMVMTEGAPDPTKLTGATVTTTLDSSIQLTTERELAKAVRDSHAASGWAMVMDVQTGAILSLASSPSFDANKPGRDPLVWKNRGVQDQLEPGSTIKSFMMAIAMEDGELKPNEAMFCENGIARIAGRTIHDTHKVGWATPSDVLRESSNICAAKIGLRLGADRLMEGYRAFGFGERTGVGLPGEGRGQLRDPKRMPLISVATSAFGQGMSATGLQTVVAMAAIANGGVLLKPYLVQKVVASDGTVLLTRGREEVRRVLSEKTAARVQTMLEEVVQRGTGTKAAIADFRVAGKTGTAQKVDPIRGGYNDKKLASFLGFAPAEAPRVAVLVAIDEPEGKTHGGDVAAPAWGPIAGEALRQLGVTPAHLIAQAQEEHRALVKAEALAQKQKARLAKIQAAKSQAAKDKTPKAAQKPVRAQAPNVKKPQPLASREVLP
ncbi:MAG: penicillin-binding protein 2, partial [Deltaproteobacteria bacterium]|nr:penicillin-binding protein 2 [Deltaproteobacteria bacterium]